MKPWAILTSNGAIVDRHASLFAAHQGIVAYRNLLSHFQIPGQPGRIELSVAHIPEIGQPGRRQGLAFIRMLSRDLSGSPSSQRH